MRAHHERGVAARRGSHSSSKMVAVTALLVVLVAGLPTSQGGPSPKKAKKEACEPISIPMCKGMRYNLTSMPNMFMQHTQDDAYVEITQEEEEESSRNEETSIQKMGVKMFGFADSLGTLQDSSGSHLYTEDDFYLVVDDDDYDYDYDDPWSNGDPNRRPRNRKCPCRKCQNGYGENPLVSIHPEDFLANKSVYFGGIPGCVMSCRSPFVDPYKNSESLLEHMMTFFTVLCLLSSIITVVAFLIALETYSYPETPIMYFAICYVMVGIGFSLRLIFGHETVACEHRYSPLLVRQYFSPHHNLLAENDSQGPVLCTLVFLCTYSFLMAAAMWWFVLTVTWFLSTVFHWAPEAIEKYSKLIHGACWGIPLLETLISVVSNAIDGDNISGLCFVGAVNHLKLCTLFLGPIILKIGLGFFFLVAGLWGVFKVRAIVDGDQKTKLNYLMVKITVFSFMFMAPMAFVIYAWIYEIFGRAKWEENVVCLDCLKGQKEKPSYAMYVAKYSMMLLPGALTFSCVLSGKLIEAVKIRSRQLLGIFKAPRKEQIYESPGARDRQQNMIQQNMQYKPQDMIVVSPEQQPEMPEAAAGVEQEKQHTEEKEPAHHSRPSSSATNAKRRSRHEIVGAESQASTDCIDSVLDKSMKSTDPLLTA